MDEKTRTELEAAAFRRLVQHLRERTDVQNIDLMNLAGFCRNCLSKWYRAAAEERGLPLTDPASARDRLWHVLRALEVEAPVGRRHARPEGAGRDAGEDPPALNSQGGGAGGSARSDQRRGSRHHACILSGDGRGAGRRARRIRARLPEVPGRALRWRPESWDAIPGEMFSAQEQACHLRDIEVEGYHQRFDRLLREEGPELASIDGYALARERRYGEQDALEALAAFRCARAKTVESWRGSPSAIGAGAAASRNMAR